jgi:hypothetical protein
VLLHVKKIASHEPSKIKNKTWRLTAASDKVYQLLTHGRWFSPGTSASSTTKTGRHDIAEILLKVALNTKIQNSKSLFYYIAQKEDQY